MTEQVSIQRGAATLTLDLGEFIASTWDEEQRDDLINLVASKIANDLSKDIRKEVGEAVRSEVTAIVQKAVSAGVQKTSTWGEPQGPVIPLKQMIIEETNAALTKPTGDAFSSPRVTVVQKIIRDEVNAALKKELASAVNEQKEIAKKAVSASAAQVISETIDRARRNLV